MSLWENVPYELQSPTFNNAMNQQESGGGGGWNPSFNTNFFTDVLSAFQSSNMRPSGEVNTVNANGQTGFVNGLQTVGTALLNHLGASDGGAAQPQPVAVRSGGMNPSNLLLIAGVGFGIYYLVNR
ncbi:hypothetical protein [Yoonia sp.]|uniref:hypothetical protein n=1 Tax=Yoonia sp. TaxID=2212373 RepID=UPI002E0AD96F|nr:hypothetical protein [Yoonia sp.]